MKNQFKILCGAVALAMAGQVSAETTWTLNTGSAQGNNSAVTVISTGWANTGAGTTYDTQILERQDGTNNLRLYGGGLGISNKDGCGTSTNSGCAGDAGDLYSATTSTAPEHAIDNQQRYEMVLLKFSAPNGVKLTNANVGWIGSNYSSSWGSDYTVLAYTGSGDPSSSTGLSTNKWSDLASDNSGWVKIGSYANATTAASGNTFSNGIYASYWLIGAYNPLVGGSTQAGVSIGNGTGGKYDALKLASVTGTVCTNGTGTSCTPPGSVPEPGSLALFGIALLGMMTLRKRQQA